MPQSNLETALLLLTRRIQKIEKRLERTATTEADAAGYSGLLEGADIDLVSVGGSGTMTVGRGGDKVLLFDDTGNPLAEYASTQAGLIAALAAADAGDMVIAQRAIPIAITTGLTIPAGVIVKDLNITASGFSGNAILMSAASQLWNSCVMIDGTTFAIARAVYANGVECRVMNCQLYAHDATANVGLRLNGSGAGTRAYAFGCTAYAYNGTNDYAIYIEDYGIAVGCIGNAYGGSGNVYGIAFAGSLASGITGAAQAHACYGRSTTNGYGGATYTAAGSRGTATSCQFTGAVGGFLINALTTLDACDNYYSSMTETGTLVYLLGDRAPSNASYLNLGTNANLTNERVFTPDVTLAVGDDGPGGHYHIGVSGIDIVLITDALDTYNIQVTDSIVVCNKATPFTVTMPAAAIGQAFTIKNIGAGDVTVAGAGVDTFDGVDSDIVLSQWDCIKLRCNAANSWIKIT